MVCQRCVMAVERVLRQAGLQPVRVELGEAVVAGTVDSRQRSGLKQALGELGFELLEDAQAVTVERIRGAVRAWVRARGARPRLSDSLSAALGRDYSALSKLFSEVTGVTIERYCISQRVEYAKELLTYGQMSVSEIAYAMGYSSPAHLSAQFKQVTGLSPNQFRKDRRGAARRPIDRL